jgi:hypothetical protein
MPRKTHKANTNLGLLLTPCIGSVGGRTEASTILFYIFSSSFFTFAFFKLLSVSLSLYLYDGEEHYIQYSGYLKKRIFFFTSFLPSSVYVIYKLNAEPTVYASIAREACTEMDRVRVRDGKNLCVCVFERERGGGENQREEMKIKMKREHEDVNRESVCVCVRVCACVCVH